MTFDPAKNPRDVLAENVFEGAEEPYSWADRVITKLFSAGYEIVLGDDEREGDGS